MKRAAMIAAAIGIWFAIANSASSQQSALYPGGTSSFPNAGAGAPPPAAPPVLGTTATVKPKIGSLTMVGGGALVMITVGLGLWSADRIGRRPASDPASS